MPETALFGMTPASALRLLSARAAGRARTPDAIRAVFEDLKAMDDMNGKDGKIGKDERGLCL